MTKTGILGGTFNPVHFAHLAMARAAMKQVQLDEIWFMPSKNPPHKSQRDIVPEEHRSQMIRLAIESEPAFRLSDFELRRGGTTYTSDTLQMLQREYPDRAFYFIIGGDSLFALENWYHPEIILDTCEILAVARNDATDRQMQDQADYLENKYQAQIHILQMKHMDISSSEIRSAIERGQEITGMVPDAVASYIDQYMLYRPKKR